MRRAVFLRPAVRVPRLLRIGGWCLLLLLVTPWPAQAQIARLPHADGAPGNFFGTAVSMDGYRALVGASGEEPCGTNSGAAYIYEREAATGTWQAVSRLVASDCEPGRFFGQAVALSGDRALVAAPKEFFASAASNAAYVFERDSTGAWREVARLTVDPAEEEGPFAASVSLDGDRALITSAGDPSHGTHNGAAYVFERDATGTWSQVARLTGSAGPEAGIFGGAGALSGDRAVVAASTYFAGQPGSVYIFERNARTGRWAEAARFDDIDDFFISVDIDGDRVLVGESKAGRRGSGRATLFVRDEAGIWRRDATLRPRKSYEAGAFGTTVSLSGDHALVTGFDEQLGFEFNIDRVVYVFEQDAGTGQWRQRGIFDIGDVAFGTSIDHNGPLAVIGHASEAKPGAAYVVHVR